MRSCRQIIEGFIYPHLEKFTDIKHGDVLEVYIIEQIART